MSESDSFSTTIEGYSIAFPKLAKQLPQYSTKDAIVYVDSTPRSRIEWLFNPYEFGKDTLYKIPDRRQAYGVNIYLKNKGNQLDSVKAALEVKYKHPLIPMDITATEDEPHFGPSGYYCELNSNAVLFLRRASCSQGDSWCQYNSLRIAIGYNLSKAERERFASSYGIIWYNVD
ncbi:hypothetical protein [Spirosoma jeollabukense]